jgi:hypothetical protein
LQSKKGKTSLGELRINCEGSVKAIPDLENICKKLKKGGKIELKLNCDKKCYLQKLRNINYHGIEVEIDTNKEMDFDLFKQLFSK